MEERQLGNLFPVSALTLGGGGIGQVWGETTRDESIATVLDAYRGGINLFDMAPLYGRGEAETVLGIAFEDGYPDDVSVTTKCMLGTVPPEDVLPRLKKSLEGSFERLGRQSVDLFVLHGYVVPDGFGGGQRAKILPKIVVPQSLYEGAVVPAMKSLVAEGCIGAWGVTSAGPHAVNMTVLERSQQDPGDAPAAVQSITNPIDSAGGMLLTDEPIRPRVIAEKARTHGIGVMGIRAVAAGALVDVVDRDLDPETPEARDYERAHAFRALAAEMGESSASLAHRYALSMPCVDTVVLGVKNRSELKECLAAEAAGPLDSSLMEVVEATFRPGSE